MSCEEKIRAGKFLAVRTYPYLSSVVLRLKYVEDDSIVIPGPDGKKLPTMAVDRGGRLHYHPDFVSILEPRELAAVIAHEAWHIVRLHAERAENVKAEGPLARVWNLACDLAINDTLQDLPNKPQARPAMPSAFGLPSGLLEEEYYERLKAKMPRSQFVLLSGNCGSGADGQGDDEGGGLSESEKKLLAREVANRIIEQSKTRGSMPASLVRWANGVLHPKVDWRKELRCSLRAALFRAAGRTDYSFLRPSRRMRTTKVILPCMVDLKPSVAVIIDTSASMSEKELSRALAEMSGILRASTGRVWFLAADANVHVKKTISSIYQAQLVGGGGTDMATAIHEAVKLKPDLIVVLTDGYTPWPKYRVRVPVIACLIGRCDVRTPEWIKTIRVEET